MSPIRRATELRNVDRIELRDAEEMLLRGRTGSKFDVRPGRRWRL